MLFEVLFVFEQSQKLIICCMDCWLIHLADPQSRPVMIIVFARFVRPSVPTFQNLIKQNKFQVKTLFTTGEIVGLGEWIMEDSCIVLHIFEHQKVHYFSSNFNITFSIKNKTGVINDPLGQIHSHAVGNIVFSCFCFARFQKSGD